MVKTPLGLPFHATRIFAGANIRTNKWKIVENYARNRRHFLKDNFHE